MCGPNSNGSGPPGAGQASHGHRPLRDSIDFLLHGRGQESTVDRQNYERSPAMCGGGDAPARRASHEIDRDIFNARRRRPRSTRLQRGAAMCGGGSSPEQDLDDPDYDAFRISRRARGRKDGPWNRFVSLAASALGARRVRSA